MIHLDDATVERLCDLASVTERVESAWRELAAGEASTTIRVRTSVGDLMASGMAAVLPSRGVAGGKLYATHPDGMDFLVVLFAAEGGVLATLDAGALTGLRTAGASALAIRYFERSGARVATVFGNGNQARWHALALAEELDLEELRVFARTPEAADGLVRWAGARGIPAVPAGSAVDAVAGSEVVVTATASHVPLFPGGALEPNTLVCAVGAAKADRRELDAAAIRRAAMIVTDGVQTAQLEAGDLIQAAAEGALDWSSVTDMKDAIAGSLTPPPQPSIIVFESQGIALQDVAAAALAYERFNAAEAT